MIVNELLGDMPAEVFLSEYWHKKPLLIRGALRDVGVPVDFDWLCRLAQDEDVESRLIESHQGNWSLENGPFRAARFQRLPDSDWTLLVQSVNHHLPHIDEILWRFNFIPYARLDDLMISYAPPGGTVGPHFDSYDVFLLLQVGGRKRWQISAQKDDAFIEGAPIRVLKDFKVEEEYILEHGDMLYLPPRYAHYGVALESGMTYSIGFRAPSSQELATEFLVYMQDRLCIDGRYADPGLKWQVDPARIPQGMVDDIAQALTQIRWDKAMVADFLGHYLSEPKAHVFYDTPEDELDEEAFFAAVRHAGVVLSRKSQILYTDALLYCNGALLDVDAETVAGWQRFANQRRLAPSDVLDGMLEVLYQGYLDGYWLPATGRA